MNMGAGIVSSSANESLYSSLSTSSKTGESKRNNQDLPFLTILPVIFFTIGGKPLYDLRRNTRNNLV